MQHTKQSPIDSVCTTAPSTTNSASSVNPVVCVETWRSGTEWYRKYSDGWIEQGGYVSASIATDATSSYNFPTAFSEGALSIWVQGKQSAKTGNVGLNLLVKATSTTDYTIINDSYYNNMLGFYWEAKGL